MEYGVLSKIMTGDLVFGECRGIGYLLSHNPTVTVMEANQKRPPLPRTLYLVKRGPGYVTQSRHPSLVPDSVHPVVICTERHVAFWEAGASSKQAWVWTHDASTEGGGWLLTRWMGLDIDYGHVVHGFTLPDGTPAAFFHKHRNTYELDETGVYIYDETPREPHSLLDGAVWWSLHRLPEWLEEAGVRLPTDRFTRNRIEERAGECMLSMSKQDRLAEKWAKYRLPWEEAELV